MKEEIAEKKKKLQIFWTSHIKNRTVNHFQLPGPGSYTVRDFMIEDPTFTIPKFAKAPRYKNPQSISEQIQQMNLA